MYVCLHLAQLPQREQEFTILPFYYCEREYKCVYVRLCEPSYAARSDGPWQRQREGAQYIL